MMRQKIPIEDRFWNKVQKTEGCWNWTGGCKENGYGYINTSRPSRKNKYAHRISWEMTYGPIQNDLWVLHKCDNRRCVKPDHLFLGTVFDNIADMVSKKRHAYGVRHGQRKLTENDVLTIRTSNKKQTALAEQFCVDQSSISNIINHKVWKCA